MVAQADFASSGGMNPAAHATAITPVDAELGSDKFTRAVYVGGAGNLAVIMAGDEGDTSAVVFVGVPAGSLLPIRVSQIRSTGTTATSIVALW